MAHVHGRPGNDKEWLDDILGRGAGDPDFHGYPGDDPKAPSQNTQPQASINTKAMSDTSTTQDFIGLSKKH